MQMSYHKPVLLDKSVEGLNIIPDGYYIDVTYGGGGHSKKILELLKNGKLLAFDKDQDSMNNKIDDKRLILVNADYAYLKNYALLHDMKQVDGIIADLGISSHQIDVAERGFSTRLQGPLDMRMDTQNPLTAEYIINTYTQEQLKTIFSEYGEIQNASYLALTIIKARELRPIKTIDDLKAGIKTCYKKFEEHKYLAKVFQTLRIEVNDELNNLKKMLLQTTDLLKSGGRLVVIAYHSLEDRLIKNFIKTGNLEGKVNKDFYGNLITPFTLITRKPVVPDEKEVENNSRARSAKLRIAQKI